MEISYAAGYDNTTEQASWPGLHAILQLTCHPLAGATKAE